jgi:hypothetical protein
LKPWKYGKKWKQQDEVYREREEVTAVRDRLAEKVWRQFWG